VRSCAKAACVEAADTGTTKVTTAEMATTETTADVTPTKTASTKMSTATTAEARSPRWLTQSNKSGDC